MGDDQMTEGLASQPPLAGALVLVLCSPRAMSVDEMRIRRVVWIPVSQRKTCSSPALPAE